MRRPLAAALMSVAVAGCGGASYTYTSGAGTAARSFVAAVTAGDRASWCADVGEPLYSSAPRGPLTGTPRDQCVNSDLFQLTGSCDRERAISGATVTGVTTSGTRTVAKLSSGVTLTFAQVNGRWLFSGVTGAPARTRSLPSGPCAGS